MMQVQFSLKKIFILLVLVMVGGASQVLALPFNDDMVDSQLKTGQIMRPKVEGTISKGSLNLDYSDWQEVEKMSNPTKATDTSISHGKRLFDVNCTACHGEPKTKDYSKGLVGEKMGPFVPNLSDTRFVEMSDGLIFGTIRNGSRSQIMPRVGYKLSVAESWDIVNYIRFMQKK